MCEKLVEVLCTQDRKAQGINGFREKVSRAQRVSHLTLSKGVTGSLDARRQCKNYIHKMRAVSGAIMVERVG
mgnify:CR=1 FL=1